MNKKTRYLCYAALFTALTAVMTAYIKSPGINGVGYIHFGDSMIYLAAALLPAPYAAASAALGGMFADLLAGAAVWAPFTFVIKAVMTIPFFLIHTKKSEGKCLKAIPPVPAGVVTIVGYYFAEVMLYHNYISALAGIKGSLVQAAGSAVIYYILAAALDKTNFAKRV